MNASKGEGLPRQIFLRSISPQLRRAPKFKAAIAAINKPLPGDAVAYLVDTQRFDRFFDHLCWAMYFDRYGEPFDDRVHEINHIYLSFTSSDAEETTWRADARSRYDAFFSEYPSLVETTVAAHLGEIVYRYQIIDPGAQSASITILHSFYGIFEVLSLLSHRAMNAAVRRTMTNEGL